MKADRFWSLWVLVLGGLVIAAGLAFAFVVPRFFPGIQDVFHDSFGAGTLAESLGKNDRRHVDWLYGVLGGVMVGWGVMLAALAYRTLTEDSEWIWNTMLTSVVSWYVVDSWISLSYGVVPNILVNTAILLLAVVPVVMRRRRSISVRP